MNKVDIFSNNDYRTTYSYPFKGMVHMHLPYNYDKLNRKYYRIYDLELWFESDFERGEKLVIKRIGENARYKFK